MSRQFPEIHNLCQLRTFIQNVLCQQEQLEPGIFPMTERILTRGGRPCGIYFVLHGPRSVRLTAIWENEHNTLLFYASTGERFLKMNLVAAPEIVSAAMAAAS